jgi:ABC-type glutathione transport system ATPase component
MSQHPDCSLVAVARTVGAVAHNDDRRSPAISACEAIRRQIPVVRQPVKYCPRYIYSRLPRRLSGGAHKRADLPMQSAANRPKGGRQPLCDAAQGSGPMV